MAGMELAASQRSWQDKFYCITKDWSDLFFAWETVRVFWDTLKEFERDHLWMPLPFAFCILTTFFYVHLELHLLHVYWMVLNPLFVIRVYSWVPNKHEIGGGVLINGGGWNIK